MMGGAKEARHSCRASKAIPISRVCEDDGFREGLNSSYGLGDYKFITFLGRDVLGLADIGVPVAAARCSLNFSGHDVITGVELAQVELLVWENNRKPLFDEDKNPHIVIDTEFRPIL